MVFAAGFGTRMGALTKDRPKPLIEVAGRPLLDHAIDAARQIEPQQIVANAHYLSAQIVKYAAVQHSDVIISEETPDILDSGGGLKRALPILGANPVATLNADAVWSVPGPLDALMSAWNADSMGALLLLVPRDRAVGRQGGGDFHMDMDGRLSWGKTPEGLVYTGAQILDIGPVAAHPDDVFSLLEIWQGYMDQGRLFGVIYPGHWADVGHPEGIALAEAMLDG